MAIKFKHLIIPFLWILLGTLAVVSLINYFFVIRLGWLPLTHMQAELIMPGILCLIGPFIWMKPRIKRWVQFKNGADKAFELSILTVS
ncbi:MAG: hypothetical protein QM724_02470 [Flavobacteriales bacterium]